MNKPWELTTTECAGSREDLMRRGNVYQLANGYMGYRGTLDEFGPDEAVGITLAGIFDQVGKAWREPVNAPNGGYTRVVIDGIPVSAVDPTVSSHRQTLHFADARFERETVFMVGGKRLTIRSVRFLSAIRPHLGIIRFTVSCDREAGIAIRTGIDGNIWDLNGPHLVGLVSGRVDGVLHLEGRTQEAGKRVAVAEAISAELGEGQPLVNGRHHLREIAIRAEPGKAYTFTKFFAVVTDQDRTTLAPAPAAIATVIAARELGYTRCQEEHAADWRRRWEGSDVLIEGDDEAQHALRYSLLQLLMVAPVAGSANSIPARALSGQVYKGAVFWDTEMFILPFFLHTDAAKAAELLRYRIRTLDGARRKARTEGPGYRGAFYAWESQDTGDDACTYFNIGDPFTGRDLRTHFRDKQVHISGDVAIAFWRYFEVTGDDTLLRQGGAEVILECARFYYSYAYFKKDHARYEVLDVVGPDEYHERVNNNAFTNQVVRETFVIANAVVEHMRRHHPAELATLLDKLAIAAELPVFADAAARLYVPAPDPDTGVIEQFEGYHQLRDATVEELKNRMVHPNEYLGAGQGLAVPTKIIKQADVVMMLNLFKARYPAAIKQANWNFYEPRTEHGSSLSACAYAMVATEFGELEVAYRYFLKTAKIDLEAKYKIYVGTIFMGGSHPAANGGAWMTVVFGFGGVHVTEQQVVINPRLYPGWSALEFPLAVRGERFRVRITGAAVTITPAATNKREHAFVVAGTPLACRPGETLSVNFGAEIPHGVASVS
ncbi:MAG TPA: glycosyl hydrolase family 65 protein [Lacunisphaera sp.]|nr:glycosyl hydrolase family 65 protein [Lacunisphaera sp.]